MKKIIIAISLILMLIISFDTVSADMGDKPSIQVIVENADPSKCEFSLLNSEGVESSYDLIFVGKTDTGIEYSYFATPDIYKIGITYEGEYKETRVIERTRMHQTIVIDWNTMEIISDNNTTIFQLDYLYTIASKVLICVLFTVLIELVLALMMGFRKYWKVILITNIFTQLLYNYMATIGEIPFMTLYIILELIILAVETYVYLEAMKDLPKGKVVIYTILANIITGYCIDKVIFQLLA